MLNFIKWFLGIVGILALGLTLFIYLGTFHPKATQGEPVISPSDAPELLSGQKIKILSWNIQYLAGKNYIFWYDLPDGSGPDEQPSPQEISLTLERLIRIIIQEDPDIILLQEVDDQAKRTHYEDQLKKILSLLPGAYVSYTSSFYWKAAFVLHPRIWGRVGMKLSIISKYKIQQAIRHQLELIKRNTWNDWIVRQFHLKRALQEVHFPVDGGQNLIVFNTHLSAFSQGTQTLEKQVNQIENILAQKDQEANPWVLGGDFNLLPPGRSYGLSDSSVQMYYQPTSELNSLYRKYQVVPSLKEVEGPKREEWFTHYPNHPDIEKPDRTIDYVFLSSLITLGPHEVIQQDTQKISDHLPIILEIEVP